MRKSTYFSKRELLTAAILFVAAAAIISGTILGTEIAAKTKVVTLAAAAKTTKTTKTTSKEKTSTGNANEKSSSFTQSNSSSSSLPLPTASPSTTTSTTITPDLSPTSSTIGTQALSSVKALQTNNIVNTRSYYDIIFKTGTTGDIAKVVVTFPSNTDITSRVTVEAGGIGRGSTTFSGNTITYNVDGSQIKSISSGTTIRLEFGNIGNPSSASSSLTVSVTTETSTGKIIEGPATSSAYSIKQIGSNDIANSAITTNKIADHAVTGTKVAGTSKLVYVQCTVSSSTAVPPGGFIGPTCSNPSVSVGDAVVATDNRGATCFVFTIARAGIGTVPDVNGVVQFIFKNECTFSTSLGDVPVSAIIFKPT